MRPGSLLIPVLTFVGVTSASPTPELGARSTETILYKRGDVLDKRGLELAALHGVDISEMYRHSLVKRSDGDDITIWVHNSFNASAVADEETSPEGLKRRGIKFPDTDARDKPRFRTDTWAQGMSDACGHSSMTSLTSSSLGAYTGGVLEIRRWGRDNPGAFFMRFRTQNGSGHTGLIVAGSNNGANAMFMVKKDPSAGPFEFLVGADDIADLARDSIRFQKSYGNPGWKTAAKGDMGCYHAQKTVKVNWRLTKTGIRV